MQPTIVQIIIENNVDLGSKSNSTTSAMDTLYIKSGVDNYRRNKIRIVKFIWEKVRRSVRHTGRQTEIWPQIENWSTLDHVSNIKYLRQFRFGWIIKSKTLLHRTNLRISYRIFFPNFFKMRHYFILLILKYFTKITLLLKMIGLIKNIWGTMIVHGLIKTYISWYPCI